MKVALEVRWMALALLGLAGCQAIALGEGDASEPDAGQSEGSVGDASSGADGGVDVGSTPATDAVAGEDASADIAMDATLVAAVPDATPDGNPDAPPDATPDANPAALPDALPDGPDDDAEAADAPADASTAEAASDATVDCNTVTPQLRVSAVGSFGAVCGGSSSGGTTYALDQFASITNTTSGPVSWSAALGSAFLFGDSMDHPPSGTLAAGATATIDILATPLGRYPGVNEVVTDTLSVTEVSPAGCTHVIQLKETFCGYFFSTTNVDFGNVQLGDSSALVHVGAELVDGPACTFGPGQPFSIGYAESVSVINSLGPAGDFVVTLSGQIPPYTGIDVRYTPTIAEPESVTVSMGGQNVSVCTPPVTITGTGTSP